MSDDPVEDARAIFEAGVRGVQADCLVRDLPWDRLIRRPLDAYSGCILLGMGKASLAMASVVESRLGALIGEGCVVVPQGYRETLPSRFEVPERTVVIEGGHPVPTTESIRAAQEMLRLCKSAGERDLVIVVISGGGSALCADFLGDITLAEARSTYELLLESGADIHALNTVRKHISRVGGGRLAEAAAPAEVLALVISDVVEDDLSVIASGPTTGDPTTYGDARSVLEQLDLWDRIPGTVRNVIEGGTRDPALETPKPGASVFDRVTTRLIGTNASALDSARSEALRRGYSVEIVTRTLTGEAREVGARLVQSLPGKRTCLLYAGETTVSVRGGGSGGRNQESALAAAVAFKDSGLNVVYLSGGTDGIDGPTDAAGAWATPSSYGDAVSIGLRPEDYLERNDSYTFFSRAGGLLRTGITHTNVGDLVVVLGA